MKELWISANVLALLFFALDKLKAKIGGRRTSNKALKALLITCPLGAIAGMLVFRHKTQQTSFWLWGLAGLTITGLLALQLGNTW